MKKSLSHYAKAAISIYKIFRVEARKLFDATKTWSAEVTQKENIIL